MIVLIRRDFSHVLKLLVGKKKKKRYWRRVVTCEKGDVGTLAEWRG